MNTVYFRADGNADIGMGHIARCLVLAQYLKKNKYRTIFLVNSNCDYAIKVLIQSGIEVIPLSLPTHYETDEIRQISDAEKSISEIAKYKSIWVIVDHYELDSKWESLVADYTEKIACFEDIPNRDHNVDALIDAVGTPLKTKYSDRLLRTAKLCLGSKYALINQHLVDAKKSSVTERLPPELNIHVFVAFGATDPNGYSIKVLRALSQVTDIDHISIATTSQNTQIRELLKYSSSSRQVSVHVDSTKVGELMAKSTIAIGAIGGMAWERCYMGLPSITIKAAEHQTEFENYLKDLGVILPSSLEGLKSSFEVLVANQYQRLKDMAVRCEHSVDENGARRIAVALNLVE